MTKQSCKDCKHLEVDGMFGIFCGVSGDNTKYNCPKYVKKEDRRMTKRFELKSIHFHKLYIIVYDNLKEEELHLSIFELVELLNEVSQKEYDLKKIGDEIKRKLDEILEKEVGE